MRRLVLLLATLALVTACDRPADRDPHVVASRALRNVLAYPRSSVVTLSAGRDAAELTLMTVTPVEEVAQWYRDELRQNGWELESDEKTADGAIAMYALKGTSPLWITLKRNVGSPGTTYTLIGADVTADSARAAPQRAGSSMSSKRMQRR